jgi:hypothetical protein
MDWREQVLNMPQQAAASFTAASENQQPFSVGMHLQPQFDVIELLPEERKEFLQKFRQRCADAHLLIPPGEDVRQSSMARVEAANAVKRLTDHPQDGGFGLKSDDRRVIVASQHLDKMTADFKRLQELQTVKTAAWQAASAALANSETWLKTGRPGNATLLDYDGPEPKLARGENGLLDAIENRRRRVRELRADLHRIASAPFPSAYAKQQMREQIEALAQRGAPDVSMLIEHDGEIIWPMLRLRVDLFGAEPGAVAFVEIPDTVGMRAWRHKSEWIAALDRRLPPKPTTRPH